ncbi:phage tail tip protein [Escherichia coli]|uniref:phage tail tip domain-containing protein n=1 Tax=Escherichia coli TaxID=562 RepID=UPI003CC90B70
MTIRGAEITQSTRYTGYGLKFPQNGALIASRETKGAIPGSYSAVIDMPSGRGSVTLSLRFSRKAIRGRQYHRLYGDCDQKAASGISIR